MCVRCFLTHLACAACTFGLVQPKISELGEERVRLQGQPHSPPRPRRFALGCSRARRRGSARRRRRGCQGGFAALPLVGQGLLGGGEVEGGGAAKAGRGAAGVLQL